MPERLGPWILGGPVGSGAMGAVFSARHAKSGQPAAIKLAVAGTDYGRLLHQEAVALAGLEHRGVVQIHDHGEEQGLVWIALQFVDGESLRDWIARRFGADDPAPLSRAEVRSAVGWMRDLALALHAMHRRGVLHRDVKPANLMLGRDGEARVIDLGLAIDLDGEPVAALAGTAPYMSPEQVLAAALVDARSDVYSLAASFHEVLSGWAVARGRGSLASVLQDVAFVDAPRLSARAPNALPGLDAVFAKALAKAPQQRYRDAAALAEDLELVLEGRSPKWAKEAVSTRWRRRVPMLVGVSALVSVLAWFGVGWVTDRAAMAEFRRLCAEAEDAKVADSARAAKATDALAAALQLHTRFADSQEFEDVYRSALGTCSGRLTRWMFQKAALTTTTDVDGTTTGLLGARAERHLAFFAERKLADETRVELAVQAAFRHIRSMRTKEARAVLAPFGGSKYRDQRILALRSMATLWEAWDAERGQVRDRAGLESVFSVVGEVGFDYANLRVDELCARAMLLLEVAEVAHSVPADMVGGAGAAAALQAALRGIEAPLEVALREAAQHREAGNYVACLLALVRLRIDEPAAAREVLETRLGSPASRPEDSELPVMAMFAAAAGFRALVRDLVPKEDGPAANPSRQATLDLPRLSSVVGRFIDATQVDPRVASRFLSEVGRNDSEPDSPLRFRFECACVAFLDLLLEQKPSNKLIGPAVLQMSWQCLDAWGARGSWVPLLEIAKLAAEDPAHCLPRTESEECASAVFWVCAINVCGFQDVKLDSMERRDLSRMFARAGVVMTGRMQPLYDLVLAKVLNPLGSGPSEAEVRNSIEPKVQSLRRSLESKPEFSQVLYLIHTFSATGR